ncbi:MAG TPA: ATP-dependent Clp protease proteolytic subunit, partial [Candidatus Aminicenantes bacterium]|nr:ATP-dependent Clp protease proteolytic subunit [Candidatus Aminicenantes bacterium]
MRRLPFIGLWLLCLSPFLVADVATLRLDGPIDALAQEYLVGTLHRVQADPQIHLIVIQLDTPGGYDTSMRAIIQEMLAARAPVAVLVSPQGARAASAGFFLLLAADIAAMAPGTNAGAASPVSALGGEIEKTMKAKVTNDAAAYIRSLAKGHNRDAEWAARTVIESLSYTAEECRDRGLIDMIAADVPSLLAQLEGRTVTRPDGSQSALRLEGERIVPYPMSPRQRFLRIITNPGLAYFLLIFGLIGLYIEFTHPGTIIPGVLGGICLLLAFLAFQILP